MNRKLLKYELINLAGNPFIIMFGIFLPIFFAILIPKSIESEVPIQLRQQVTTAILISLSTYIPLCLSLIGYGSIYSQETEKKIPLRLSLFGIPKRKLILAKVLSQIIVSILALILYSTAALSIYKVKLPTLKGFIIYSIIMLLLAAFLLMFSHGIADIIGRFGPAYAIIMLTYFVILFLSGNMGLRYKDMPRFMQRAADLLPTTHLGEQGYAIWTSASTNYAPMIQSFIFLGALCSLVLIASIYKANKNKI